MQLMIRPDGTVACLYGEAINLTKLGGLTIRRASHVEPDENGWWHADLSPVNGPVLGPFEARSEALSAEEGWIEANVFSN